MGRLYQTLANVTDRLQMEAANLTQGCQFFILTSSISWRCRLQEGSNSNDYGQRSTRIGSWRDLFQSTQGTNHVFQNILFCRHSQTAIYSSSNSFWHDNPSMIPLSSGRCACSTCIPLNKVESMPNLPCSLAIDYRLGS
jgi:hypothetical protein